MSVLILIATIVFIGLVLSKMESNKRKLLATYTATQAKQVGKSIILCSDITSAKMDIQTAKHAEAMAKALNHIHTQGNRSDLNVRLELQRDLLKAEASEIELSSTEYQAYLARTSK